MKRHLNLMSSQARVRETVRWRTRQWLRVLAVVGLFLAQLGIIQWWRCDQEWEQLDVYEAQYEPFRQMKSENKKVQRQIETILDRERIPLALAKERPVVTLLGTISKAVVESQRLVYIKQLDFHQDILPTGTTNELVGDMVIEGVGIDGKAVAQLTESLRHAVPFADVKLTSTETVDTENQRMQAFTIQCSF